MSAARTTTHYQGLFEGPEKAIRRKMVINKDKKAVQKIYELCKDEMEDMFDAAYDLYDMNLQYQTSMKDLKDIYKNARGESVNSQLVIRTLKQQEKQNVMRKTRSSVDHKGKL